MWPTRLEMTRDECRKCLRCLELDAYGSMVSVLRAQGPFTNEKQKLLQELANVLHISNERYRAEVRRAVNDEKLATIAEQLNGPNTGTDWAIEGRRTIPLLPRLKAQSAFTTLANSLSLATAAANEKKSDRLVIPEKSEKSTVAKIESQPQIETEKESLIDIKLCSLESDLESIRTLQEPIEEEKIFIKDVTDKINQETKISQTAEKRKSPSPLSIAPPNKVLVVEAFNHTVLDKTTFENNGPRTATNVQSRVTLFPHNIHEITGSKENSESDNLNNHTAISSNKYINTTISICTNDAKKSNTKTETVQSEISTKGALDIKPNKQQSENSSEQTQDKTGTKVPCMADNAHQIQRSENSSTNASCTKHVASIIHANTKSKISKPIISNAKHLVMTVPSGTTASSGPGPPHFKATSATFTCKKLPSEQTATAHHQTITKMVKLDTTAVAINSKKTVNIPNHSNTKLTAKTNIIVVQKGHAKGVTLSHAGKEALGKVVMAGKNLSNQHNASSVGVLPSHISHISLNNVNQTTTILPTANLPNIEPIKTSVKLWFPDSSAHSPEPKTVIQSVNACLLEESNVNIFNSQVPVHTDFVITSTTGEKQLNRKNKDVNTSMNSQVMNLLDAPKSLENKEILVKSRQRAEHVGNNTCTDGSNNDIDAFREISKSDTSTNLVNKKENCILEEPRNSLITINPVDEYNDS